MAENSKIEWTTHTFNPWRGCTKVSAGCLHCYADTLSKRNPGTLGVWGPNGTRVVASESMWHEPFRWNKASGWWCDSCQSTCFGLQDSCRGCGNPCRRPVGPERPRVFCASMADVFEDWPGLMSASDGDILHVCNECGAWRTMENMCHGPTAHYALTMQDVRKRLFALIDATPNLDWLLLTKRPENVLRMTFDAWCKRVPGHVSQNPGDGFRWEWPSNVYVINAMRRECRSFSSSGASLPRKMLAACSRLATRWLTPSTRSVASTLLAAVGN